MNGITSYARFNKSCSYFIITGRTAKSAENAPFLKGRIAVPLEVPPSGYTIMGGYIPSFSILCCLSFIYSSAISFTYYEAAL